MAYCSGNRAACDVSLCMEELEIIWQGEDCEEV